MTTVTAKSRMRSTLRGYCYMISRLNKHWMQRVRLRLGGYDRAYKRKFGHYPNYDDPKALTEKLAWMRQYDRNPLYTQLVDKVAVRDYVRERVGDDILIPLYGVWDDARDIDFESLPDSFVLKCNHESGFVIICPDKANLDTVYARAQLATRLKMNHYYRHGEWPYLNVKPRIMAEKLLVSGDGGEPVDYKIHCFNGEPHYIFTMKDRHSQPLRGNYSLDWKLLPYTADAELPTEPLPKPPQLGRLVEIAAELSRGLPYCRVDLYEAEGKVYFGEITLIINAGLLRFNPISYDRILGDMLQLPNAGRVT